MNDYSGTQPGEAPVPKVCQNPMFFVPLGLALSACHPLGVVV